MRVTAVESTTLATVAFDEAQALLELEFRSQEVYQYFGVPAAVHEALLAAPSKGGYFNQAIRPWFQYRRVSRSVEQTAASDGGGR
jgi:hypothetical protein